MDKIFIGIAIVFAYVSIAMFIIVASKKKLAKNGYPKDELNASAMIYGVYWPIVLLIWIVCIPVISSLDFIYESLEKDN